jgi:hypothetical protein
MVVNSYTQLEAYIKSLPAPASGKVRLFRGQNQHYGKILATAHRGHSIGDRYQWDRYCNAIARHMLKKEGNASLPDIETLAFWIRAMSQHYGPGTEFLDVTKSLEVAVWFALTRIIRKETAGYSGPPGDLRPEDVLTIYDYLTTEKWNDNGVIYVLDVPESNEVSMNKVNHSIDLSQKLVSVFNKSERIRVQHASLFLCDLQVNGGDASAYLTCEPIAISPRCLEEKEIRKSVSYFFQPPEKDEWFKRFIRVPYKFHGFTEDGRMTGIRSIPVELYDDPEDPAYFNALISGVTTRSTFNQYLQHKPADREKALYEKANVILLPNPVLQNSPGANPDYWHEELLWRYLNLRPFDGSTGTTDDFDRTNPEYNFFVEFSTLESPMWVELDEKTAGDLIPRAIWIRIYRSMMIDVTLWLEGYNLQAGGRLEFSAYFKNDQKRIDTIGGLDARLRDGLLRPLFVVMKMIGDWMPGPKICPLPLQHKDGTYFCAILDKWIRIQPGDAPVFGTSKYFYGAFIFEDGTAYKGAMQLPMDGRMFKVKSTEKFGNVPLDTLVSEAFGQSGIDFKDRYSDNHLTFYF